MAKQNEPGAPRLILRNVKYSLEGIRMPEKKGIQGRRSEGKWFKIVAFSCFLLVFLFSSVMAGKTIAENSAAKSGYSQLQALVEQEEYENAGDEAIPPPPAEAGENAGENPTADWTEAPETVIQPQNTGIDFSALQEINPDMIGWIRAEGTGIDYPIAQTDNNEYYLNHLYNKKRNSSGTIFADYRNTGDFSDRNTVLYGHHMKSRTMFHALEEYKDQEFYNVNPVMTLLTPNGNYTVELICGTVEDGNQQFVQFDFDTEEAFLQYVEGFRARSTFVSGVELQPGDRIVSLCTCSYEWENARYVMIGRLVPVMEVRSEE